MSTSIDRRRAFGLFAGAAALPVLASCGATPAQAKSFPVRRSEAEWRKRLTKAEFNVLRRSATERAGSSPLDREKRAGTFVCAGCGNALFSSKTKYDSGTGWPSFWKPLAGAVGTGDRLQDRPAAHRSALRRLRRASRPCLRRRAQTHRQALLHERRGYGFPAGLIRYTFTALPRGNATGSSQPGASSRASRAIRPSGAY